MSLLALPSLGGGELAVLIIAAGLAGLVRGFSGFGAAMIFVPLASVVVDPRLGVVTLFLIDLTMGLPMFVRALRYCAWRPVLLLWSGAALAVPLGSYLLVTMDAVQLRWVLALIILGLVALLLSGWRYHGKPSVPATLGVGGLAGAMGGLAGLSGPPLAAVLVPLYGVSLWLGAHCFGKSNEKIYRGAALSICAAAALLSLPLWDLFW